MNWRWISYTRSIIICKLSIKVVVIKPIYVHTYILGLIIAKKII